MPMGIQKGVLRSQGRPLAVLTHVLKKFQPEYLAEYYLFCKGDFADMWETVNDNLINKHFLPLLVNLLLLKINCFISLCKLLHMKSGTWLCTV